MMYSIAADVEELVVNYLVGASLAPATQIGVDMPTTPTMPFYLVQRIAGGDDMITDHSVVSVHAFHNTRTQASSAARSLHLLMRQLTAKKKFTLSSGSAFIDWFLTLETPAWRDYADKNLQRYCARYQIDLRLNQTS